MRTYGEPCELEDRNCTECGECDRCELNAEKICDNCCKCIESDADYAGIEIEEILINTEENHKTNFRPNKFKIKPVKS